jgi:hypothetical protein
MQKEILLTGMVIFAADPKYDWSKPVDSYICHYMAGLPFGK